MRPLTLLVLALTTFAGFGCGQSAATSSPPAPPTTVTGPPQPTLKVALLPGMRHADRQLSAATLGREAAGLSGQLAGWGYRAGSEREFKGNTGDFQDVVSRTLLFDSPAGAESFMGFVHAHPDTWLGTLRSTKPVTLPGKRTGFVLSPVPCGCHRETLLRLLLAAHGPRVTWLMVNGPRATTARTLALAGQAP